VVSEHFEHHDMGPLQTVARQLADLAPATVALLTAGSAPDLVFVVAAGPDSGCDLSAVGPAVAELLQGRGGGRGGLFQGKAGDLSRRAEAVEVLSRSLQRRDRPDPPDQVDSD
jgi:alanyl-tRNA synthetase